MAACRRHPLLLAYLAALVPAMLMAFTQPVWSLVDEAQHADFIVQLSHGVYPVADTTLVDSETLSVMKSTGVFRAFYPKGTYPAPDLTDVGPIPQGMSARANATWMGRHVWQLSHESVQTPGYYLLMVPIWMAADRLGGPFGAIYAIRFISALLVAALAPMAVAVARILAPRRGDVVVAAALFAVLLPGLALNGTRIGNDALAAALGGLLVLLAIRSAGRQWSWRYATLVGLLMGAGLMVKLTLAGVLPVLAIAALWPAPGTTWAGRLARFLWLGAIAAICLVPWFVLNLDIYGSLLPGLRAARLSDSVPGPLTAPFFVLDLAIFEVTYWTGEPWGALPLAGLFAVVAGLLALMAPVGVIRQFRTAASSASRGRLATAVAAVVALSGTALLLPATAGYEFVGPGRYAYPALPAIATLLALGVFAALQNRRARLAAIAIYSGVAVIMLTAAAAGLPPPKGTGPRVPPPDARTVDVSGTGALRGVTITVDRIALDPGARATWFEVRVSNLGPGEAEWSPVPVASSGGMAVNGDYRMSTQLPGDIDPGQTLVGWLMVPLDPAGVTGGGPVQLRFPSVAVDNYATVEDVDVAVAVPRQ